MSLQLNTRQNEIQNEAKIFAEEFILPRADQFEQEEKISPEVLQLLGEKGYLGSMISTEYNGQGLDMVSIGLQNEEIGKTCSGTRSLLTVHGMLALALSRWGSDEQRDEHLPLLANGQKIGAFALTEPNVGSDAKSIETTAVQKDSFYLINGIKKWITMGQLADLFLVFASYNGQPTAFLVEKDAPGLKIEPMRGIYTSKASMLAELHFTDCQIPLSNRVCKEGTGLTHVALNSLDYGRYTIAWGCVGLAQACLESAAHYSCKRKQFNAPLRSNQLIQKMISEMVVNIQAARLLCLHAGELKDAGSPESIMATWNAKYFASKMANQVAGDAVQIHGANGLSEDYRVARLLRDAKCTEIIEGTSQMHEVLIAMSNIRSI